MTPLLAMKSRALFTLLILWTLILPLSGLGNRSPANTQTHTNREKSHLAEVEHVSTFREVQVTAPTLASLETGVSLKTKPYLSPDVMRE